MEHTNSKLKTCPAHTSFMHCIAAQRHGRNLRDELDRQRGVLPECKHEQLARAVLQTTIPPRFWGKTLRDFEVIGDNDKALVVKAVISGYLSDFRNHRAAGRGVILAGSLGTGKTLLASAVIFGVIRLGYKARYFTATSLLRAIRETWQPDAKRSEASLLEELAELDLLAIDEVGAGFRSDAEAAQLGELIDLRYQRVNPTMLISNSTMEDLTRCIGDRSVDRLRENGGKLLICDWPSWRSRG